MFKESGAFHGEKEQSASLSIPVEIAEHFVQGTLLDDARIVYEGDKSVIYRCFERDEDLPGFQNTKLRIDFKKYDNSPSERLDRVCFEYVEGDDEQRMPFAEMHLAIQDPQTFVLEHRYVAPELRTRSGLGTRLLETAEGWVQQVAQASGHPVSVILKTGQESVIRWAEKMGYEVAEEQRELLRELETHPESFEQDQVILSERSQARGVVKDLYTFRKGTEGRYMEDAVRLTFTKNISNE